LAHALNYGLQYCSYELVARMDSDDICMPDRFEKQIDFIQRHDEIALVGSNILEFYDSSI
jgi:glycosyltransferase involved in cell wall biosynthesis